MTKNELINIIEVKEIEYNEETDFKAKRVIEYELQSYSYRLKRLEQEGRDKE